MNRTHEVHLIASSLTSQAPLSTMDEPSAAIKAARARLKDKFKKNARLNIRLLLLPLCCLAAGSNNKQIY